MSTAAGRRAHKYQLCSQNRSYLLTVIGGLEDVCLVQVRDNLAKLGRVNDGGEGK